MMVDWLQGPFVYALYASYGCLPGIPGVFQAIGCATSWCVRLPGTMGFPCEQSKDSRGRRMQLLSWLDSAAAQSLARSLGRWLTNMAAGILPPLGMQPVCSITAEFHWRQP